MSLFARARGQTLGLPPHAAFTRSNSDSEASEKVIHTVVRSVIMCVCLRLLLKAMLRNQYH